MRETYSSLQTACQDYTRDTSSAALTFFKSEINRSLRFIFTRMAEYVSQKTQTTTTVANQQYYHYPPDINDIESVSITIGAVTYTLQVVDSQANWNKYNAVNFTGTSIPQFFFPRRDDFGVWPIPTDAYTMTMDYTYRLRDLINDDYSTGTVSTTQDSQTITGSGTTFTSSMVGRWFKSTTDGYFYRIRTFNSSTSLTLESVFEGASVTNGAYVIGESPEIPPELHVLIAYHAVAMYYSGFRKDSSMSIYWNNMFWTGDPQNNSRDMQRAMGGLLGAIKRYAKRSNSPIIRRNKKFNYFKDRLWAITLSDS